MSNLSKSSKNTLFDFLFSLIAMPITILAKAYVALSLYVWFVLSMFPNAPIFSLGHVIGITMLLGFLRFGVRGFIVSTKREKNEGIDVSSYESFFYSLAIYGLVQLIGYITYTFLVK